MKIFFAVVGLVFFSGLNAQELFVFSEPASNMPAHSLSVKQSFKGLKNMASGSTDARYTTELMWGLNKDLMLHASTSFSNMYGSSQRWESVRTYAKYRFLSDDGLYSHFRMSAYAEADYSRNRPVYDELSTDGDQSGVQAGIIATKLLHRFAISGSAGMFESLQRERFYKDANPQFTPYSAVIYSVSAGYLVLPHAYTDYQQTNLNLYVELLGQQATDLRRHYLDLAPAAQLIFNSQARLNIGYRFQLNGNMARMSDRSWLVSFEWMFLNAL